MCMKYPHRVGLTLLFGCFSFVGLRYSQYCRPGSPFCPVPQQQRRYLPIGIMYCEYGII